MELHTHIHVHTVVVSKSVAPSIDSREVSRRDSCKGRLEQAFFNAAEAGETRGRILRIHAGPPQKTEQHEVSSQSSPSKRAETVANCPESPTPGK